MRALQEGALVQRWTCHTMSSEHVCCFDLHIHAWPYGGSYRYRDTLDAEDESDCKKCDQGWLSKEGSTQAADCTSHFSTPLFIHTCTCCMQTTLCLLMRIWSGCRLVLPAAASLYSQVPQRYGFLMAPREELWLESSPSMTAKLDQ